MVPESESLVEALRLFAEKCPRLVGSCYWAGTASIALEESAHRRSTDLAFHTRRALVDVRSLMAEIQGAFVNALEIVHPPDEFGSGFRGMLTLPTGSRVAVEVFSNCEDVPGSDLVRADLVEGIQRVSLRRYLADKIQCVAERTEARDLVDIYAVPEKRPELSSSARRSVAEQDALILAERLTRWTDDAIDRDLRAYADASPGHARQARDLIESWLKSEK